MLSLEDLVGSYQGRCRVREGMENALGPAEKKRFLKSNEAVPLELRADGSFFFKKTTEGRCDLKGETLIFIPLAVSGMTEAQMRQAAEEAGRVFGLAWLFAPFELKVLGETLVSPDEKGVIYTEYVREGS